MADRGAGLVEAFLAKADATLGGRYSAVLYGSAARGDFVSGRSDVNLMLVLDSAAPETLRALAPAFAAWKDAGEPPLLVSRTEWARAGDAFPIEIADMRAAYRVLRGPDPLDGLRVEPTDLRRALEREFRGKLLRLRQGYTAGATDPAALGTLAGQSAATIMVLLRALLTLLGRAVPRTPAELVAEAAVAMGADGEPLLHVVRHRGERNWRCEPSAFERYMAAVEQAASFLDQLQPGDQ